jgi:hypothetical protein
MLAKLLEKHGLLPNVQVVGESAQGGRSRCASCLPSQFRGVRVSSARPFSYPRVEANYAKREVCGRAIGCSAKTPRQTRNGRMRSAHTSLQRHLRTLYRSAPRSLQCSHFIKSKLRSHSPAYGDVIILKRRRCYAEADLASVFGWAPRERPPFKLRELP